MNDEDLLRYRDEFIASKILELKICEPSCGSGHFLFGTLDFLSSELASLGIHSDSDKKQFYWQVITNCLYGIDIFADVLEICKFVLWLKGKESAPEEAEFTFKEINLKHGNYEYPISLQLIKDGRKNKVLNKKISLKIFVNMIHGNKDEVVPSNYSKKILKIFTKAKKKILIVKNGDHSLSGRPYLKKIISELNKLISNII